MTAITGVPLNHPHTKPIDTSQLKLFNIAEAPEDVFNRFTESRMKLLEFQYSTSPDLSNSPTYKDYAHVMVDGEVVAKINNQGFVETSNALGLLTEKGMPGDAGGQKGPILAQARAEFIADQLGGEIVKLPTAMTQAQFKTIPEYANSKSSVDYEAMKNDPAYQSLQKSYEARTHFLAQLSAQQDSTDFR